MPDLVHENAEDRFTALFGSRRTPSSRPASPLPKDYERSSYAPLSLFSEKGNSSWRLYSQETKHSLTPLVWLVSCLPGQQMIYYSSFEDWRDDAREQLRLLATLLGDRGTFATRY